MKYIKLFETHADYAAYIGGSDKVLPNVSYCKNENELHYNPYTDSRLIAKFNVEDDSLTTMIYGGMDYDEISVLEYFSKIEVDGVEISLTDLDENDGNYQLSEGEHTIKYTLSNPIEIGEAAFRDCTCITGVTIPNTVTSIGDEAFYHCTSLTSITIGNSVTSIGQGAFSSCSGLTSITVDSGNTVYDSRNNCNAIIETSTNTLIAGCQNTVIPNTVTSIGSSAFSGCSGLTSITIPDSVTSIGQSAFSYCTGLTTITIPDSVTSIGSSAFSSCSGLTSVTIPNGVTSIGQSAFGNCTGLTSITIPNGVTSIGQSAFGNCTGLTSITIPNGVTSIGQSAFSYCTGLTTITIPDSVTSIGQSAFHYCSGLTSITSLATTAPTIQNATFFNIKTGGTLTVPSGSTGYNVWMNYLGNYSWSKVETSS